MPLLDYGYNDIPFDYEKNPELVGLLRKYGVLKDQQPGMVPQAAPSGQATPAVPTAPVTPTAPSANIPAMADPVAGLLTAAAEKDKNKSQNKWALPLGLGLLNMGAGLMGPYIPATGQAPPYARGIQGLSQGVLTGAKLQEAQGSKELDRLHKMAQTITGLKAAYAQPERVKIGEKWYVKQANGKLLPEEGTSKKTEIDKLMEDLGISRDEAIQKQAELKAKGTAAGKPEKPEKTKTTIKEMLDPNNPTGPPKLFLLNSETGEVMKEVGTSKTGGEIDFSPEGIDMMSRNFILTGQVPGLGLGRVATQARMKIMNNAARIMANEGLTPTDIQANKSLMGAFKAEASRIQSQRGPMLAFADTADKNLDVALNLSSKVGRTGVPVLNRWLLAGRKSVAGDPDVAAFDAATRVAINEFAKVTSSATGGGVTSDAARKEIESMLHSAQTPEQFQAVVNTLRTDMKNRVSGYENSLNRVKQGIELLGQTKGGESTSSPRKTSGQPQPITTKNAQPIGKTPDGKTVYRGPDGKNYIAE